MGDSPYSPSLFILLNKLHPFSYIFSSESLNLCMGDSLYSLPFTFPQ